MQGLHRVHSSRSIGLSCAHSTSNAPSQPATPVAFPDHTGNLRSSGSSPDASVASTLTSSWPERRSAQSSAAAAGPMISSWPPDLNSTAGAGSGSGSAAAASKAAIFGADFSADQPLSSRMLTNDTLALDCAASSPNNAASCVQATRTSSPPPSAAWNAPASLRQSSWCTASGAPSLSASVSALASSATVLLQLQTLSVLPSRLIVFLRLIFGTRLLLFFLLVLFREQKSARLVQRRQHLVGNRLASGPVARIGLERIGNVEMRIGEQLLQRRAAQRVLHLRMHEAGKLGVRRELVDRRQLGRLFRRFALLRQRLFRLLAFQPRPALEEFFLVLGHQRR